ncbi:MAG: glycosyltransferase family 4 protein [candidate division WOR-3 bacterium]
MKILFGSYQAISILEGGVKTQVWALKTELEKLGHEVTLFNSWENIQLRDYDFVHLFCAHIGTYHLAQAISALGVKIILTPIVFSRRHPTFIKLMLPYTKLAAKFGGFYHYYIVSELSRQAKLILANTQAECDLIHRAFGVSRNKIKFLPNGVEERFYFAEPDLFTQKYGLKDFMLYVGHIGWPRKNLLRFLEVSCEFDVPLVLIGKILENSYAHACVELIKKRRHTLVISDLDYQSPILASAYAACDLFILPSYYETPGLAALEAALAGAKIVITQYGGTKEYFREYAHYLNPYSKSSIRAAITQTLSKKKEPQLREYIRQNYLWRRCAEDLVEIYKSV